LTLDSCAARLAPSATQLFRLSAPTSEHFHVYETDVGSHVLLPDGNRIFDLDGETARELTALQGAPANAVVEYLSELGIDPLQLIDDEPIADPPVKALSLAVAQKCNLGCAYCYAQGGAFGGPSMAMPVETALRAVDMLFAEAIPGDRVNLAFMGGEPLIARQVIHEATKRAVQLARQMDVVATFSITTNGTLVTPADAEFFEAHGFAVTVSLDGVGQVHDLLRPSKGGQGSFDRIMARIQPLLGLQHSMQVSVRTTVTPTNLALKATLDYFVEAGFHSVGFSPLLNSPTGDGEMGHKHLELMLEQMVECGEEFERRMAAGDRYPFNNMVNAMREIHRGTHRPYPCGAGAGYLGVSASGDLSACHRFVGDEEGALGSVTSGIDRERQKRWLSERHVHRQEPCKSCWARHMCGGGCHHEVIHRGRPACDYIRGWLHYCLSAYSRLIAVRPDYFGQRATQILE